MRGSLGLLFLVLIALGAAERTLSFGPRYKECFGMYSKKSVPGSKISPMFVLDVKEMVGEFAYIMYNYHDESMIGYKDPETGAKSLICTTELKENGKCYENHVGEFIVDHTQRNISEIMNGGTYSNNGDDDINLQYHVKRKALYCVMFHNLTEDPSMLGLLHIVNPYGDLPADIYPFLPFYGFVGLGYLVIGILWLILCGCYWKDILQVQNYITGIIFLCMVEMTFQYAFYAEWNDSGSRSNALLTIAVVLNSARNSGSFVCLVVVCMGYGMVKPTLGTTAHKILALGFAHFIFGTLFAASSMLQTASTQKFLALLFVFPLAVTLTLFYSWTFNSLSVTIKKLEVRRQTAKISVYKWLWRILMLSIVVLLIFLILAVIQRYDDEYQKTHWDTLWFTADGWVNLLYFFSFGAIIFLWRPSSNNSRYSPVEGGGAGGEEGDEDRDAMISSVGSNIKMRALKKKKSRKGGESDEEEDALKWVEENISDPEDPDPLTLEEEDEEKVVRRELAKMN